MELLCEHYQIRNAALRTGIEKVVIHYFFSHAVKKCRCNRANKTLHTTTSFCAFSLRREAASRTGIEKVVIHYFFSHAVKKCRCNRANKTLHTTTSFCAFSLRREAASRTGINGVVNNYQNQDTKKAPNLSARGGGLDKKYQ